MARRGGKPSDYLASDDYTGVTTYASKLRYDYWGNFVRKPLLRNLQEIATPLLDPYPVPDYRGPTYENIPNTCVFETLPSYVGNTNIPTPLSGPGAQYYAQGASIGDAEIGCTFIVWPD